MPPELLAAYEAKHPAKWSLEYIIRNQARCQWFASVFLVVWIAVVLATGVWIAVITNPAKNGALVIGLVTFTVIFAGGPLMNRIDHREEWSAILESFETALKDETFGLMSWLLMGFNLKRIRESADSRLVYAAERVIAAQKRFDNARLDTRIRELGMIDVAQGSLQRRVEFDKVLARAVEFGLSDGNPRPYFMEVERNLPIPSEGRYKY